RGARRGRRRDREPRRVDPLQLRDPGRARAARRAARRGPPLERRRARGVAAALGDLRAGVEADRRPRPRRLPRRAGVPGRPMNDRVERLQASLEEPLLVTDPANVRYLTGFESTNAAVLVDRERVRLFADFRYAVAGRAVAGVEFVETERALYAGLARLLSG